MLTRPELHKQKGPNSAAIFPEMIAYIAWSADYPPIIDIERHLGMSSFNSHRSM